MFHLRLTKSLSYAGVVTATSKKRDVFTEDKATAEAAVATGYFRLVTDEEEAAPQQTAHLDKAQLESMSFEDLKALAVQLGIDTKVVKKKVDLIAAIAATEVTPGPATDEEGNEVDYGEGEEQVVSPTMAALQES